MCLSHHVSDQQWWFWADLDKPIKPVGSDWIVCVSTRTGFWYSGITLSSQFILLNYPATSYYCLTLELSFRKRKILTRDGLSRVVILILVMMVSSALLATVSTVVKIACSIACINCSLIGACIKCSLIGEENSCHSLIQSDAKPNQWRLGNWLLFGLSDMARGCGRWLVVSSRCNGN